MPGWPVEWPAAPVWVAVLEDLDHVHVRCTACGQSDTFSRAVELRAVSACVRKHTRCQAPVRIAEGPDA